MNFNEWWNDSGFSGVYGDAEEHSPTVTGRLVKEAAKAAFEAGDSRSASIAKIKDIFGKSDLWFESKTAPEEHLQSVLRKIADAIADA